MSRPSPTAPVVLVRKRDGTLRYCIDYRKLNQVTQKDSYPLPNIQDCLDSLDGARFFSSMDLSSGYWQVKMSEDAKDKTSFYGAGGGLWRFTVMPFGLCNAPATFERLMERVLGQLQWQICLCYLDDILIYSKTVHLHLDHLRTVFQRLREARLKLTKEVSLFPATGGVLRTYSEPRRSCNRSRESTENFCLSSSTGCS